MSALEAAMRQSVHRYLAALEAGDAVKLVSMFAPDGWVLSPFLGRIAAREFFPKVVQASSGARLTVHDVLASVEGNARAAAYFRYDWWLKDGSLVSFECADVFDFDPATGAIRSLVILYDTHPLREPVGSQFA
jgi:ketosteroid isomerase-like protein